MESTADLRTNAQLATLAPDDTPGQETASPRQPLTATKFATLTPPQTAQKRSSAGVNVAVEVGPSGEGAKEKAVGDELLPIAEKGEAAESRNELDMLTIPSENPPAKEQRYVELRAGALKLSALQKVGEGYRSALRGIAQAKSVKYRYEHLTQTQPDALKRPLSEVLRQIVKSDAFFEAYIKTVGQQRKLLGYNARKAKKEQLRLSKASASALFDYIKGKCCSSDDVVEPATVAERAGLATLGPAELPEDPALLRGMLDQTLEQFFIELKDSDNEMWRSHLTPTLERHFHLARCILLELQKVVYSKDDLVFNNLVLGLRYDFAVHLGANAVEKCSTVSLAQDDGLNSAGLSSAACSLFESNVSELVGFTYGHDQEHDLKGTRLLTVLAVRSFIDRVSMLFDGVPADPASDKSPNVFLDNLVYLAQNHGDKQDGFPLIPVLFDITSRCSRLFCIDRDSTKQKTPEQQQSLEYWRHHQKVFQAVAQEHFGDNAFEAYNEYVYHFILSFCIVWRGGLERLEEHYKWNKELHDTREQRLAAVNDGTSSKTVEQVMEEALVFPYRALLSKRLEEEDAGAANACESSQYAEMLNEVEIFVLYRIQGLAKVRVSQTDFRLINAKATRPAAVIRRQQTVNVGKKIKRKQSVPKNLAAEAVDVSPVIKPGTNNGVLSKSAVITQQ